MKQKQEVSKRHSLISYLSLTIGIGCFFIVFVPFTRIANNGSLIGDVLTFLLSVAGILLSIAALLNKKEKKIIPIISFLLSSSFFLFWIIAAFLLITGQMDFAP
ncbi:hypothetical protein [Gracilibacillus timonensis]|uniref:hypothetical protein n=1 Tax=Gracilibacillus timonensis TaxID=1816696 RepID=UPI0008256B1A|nr:hypothetical protein [Gracilibacillus timonensis]